MISELEPIVKDYLFTEFLDTDPNTDVTESIKSLYDLASVHSKWFYCRVALDVICEDCGHSKDQVLGCTLTMKQIYDLRLQCYELDRSHSPATLLLKGRHPLTTQSLVEYFDNPALTCQSDPCTSLRQLLL